MTAPILEPVAVEEASELAILPRTDLAARSAAEMGRFFQGGASDDGFAYELFRRALVDRDERAWEDLYAQYRGLVFAWLRRHPAYTPTETDDARVNAAFARFWAHIPPARFASFPSVAALLRYLKLCVHAELLDDARAHARDRLAAQSTVEMEQVTVDDVADITVGHLTLKELWAVIVATTAGEEERIVAESALLGGMKAAEIHARHPALFADVGQVYRVKRNLLERLQRSAAVRALCR